MLNTIKMKPALAFNEPSQPHQWHELPNGMLILKNIEQRLSPWWPRLFGYHLLKIGSLSNQLRTTESPISHQVNVTRLGDNVHVCADIDDLPFQEHSVDACLLNHCLEFTVDPHHVLREADRVLIPNGHLILTGYNPFSLAGLNQLLPHRRKKLPWNGRFFTPMRVKDWLHLLGYEILDDQRFLHANLHSSIDESGWMYSRWQRFAQKYLSSFGSVYLIVAKKRVHPLTPIRPKWKIRPNFETVKLPTYSGNCKVVTEKPPLARK